VLPGVTRGLVIALATAAGIPVRERRLRASDLLSADEALLSASVSEVVPIVGAGEQTIAAGRPGPLTRRIQGLYREAVQGGHL
jgi:branched-subunit amino acid aminotransferase/4-amino-4-deoxychorismate lyase